MSRLAVALLVLALAGCSLATHQTQAPAPLPPPLPAVVPEAAVQRWLAERAVVAALTPEEAQAELSAQAGRGETHWQQYRYALLNQRLGDNAGWIRARDILRELRDSNTLDPGCRQLATVLLDYSQAMINASARQQQLATELADAQRQQEALAAKIEALTHLERSISERKNHGEDQPDG